jgi:hypothetical protein
VAEDTDDPVPEGNEFYHPFSLFRRHNVGAKLPITQEIVDMLTELDEQRGGIGDSVDDKLLWLMECVASLVTAIGLLELELLAVRDRLDDAD